MKTTLLVFMTIIGFVLPVEALDIRAITSKPTAIDPQFKNKEAWPMLVGDEYFLKQKWEKGRTYIWNVAKNPAKPSRNVPDGSDPSNWIDAATGKLATELPDMNSDLIMPDSEIPYKASLGEASKKGAACRHITVGKNATFWSWGQRGHRFQVQGNVWIRPSGGMMSGQGNLAFVGDKHTFLRYDWPEDGVLKKTHDERLVSPFKENGEVIKTPWMVNTVATYMGHNKAEGISTEVLGFVRLADEVRIQGGIFVIGRDSRFTTSGPSCVSVGKGAKVVLMDGAMCCHAKNQFVNKDWGVGTGAVVTGGTPDRPLKRDAYFGLGYRNWMNLTVPPPPEKKQKQPPKKPQKKKEPRRTPDGTIVQYGYGGYSASVDGSLIGYPASGSKARLVVCWQRISSGGAGNWGRGDEAFQKVFPSFPAKIAVSFGKESMVENVRFDDLQFGGIVLPSMDIFNKWKNISFGDSCLGKKTEDHVRAYAKEFEEGARVKFPLNAKPPYNTMQGKSLTNG
jgi:hypothetical protein